MTLIQAAILGVVQGATEFLPVSSSGHLVIAQQLLRFQEPPVTFDIFLHLATLLAVVIFFRAQLKTLTRPLAALLILSTVPAVIVGLILKPFIDTLFNSVIFLSFGFFISAVFLFLSDRPYKNQKNLSQITPKNALTIGIFQAVAIIPSISRSGATIFAGLRSNLTRDTAVTFAFLMSIPAILGAVFLEIITLDETSNLNFISTLVGMVAAFLVGFFSIKLLLKLVVNSKLYYFAWYCLFMALVTLFWGWRSI